MENPSRFGALELACSSFGASTSVLAARTKKGYGKIENFTFCT